MRRLILLLILGLTVLGFPSFAGDVAVFESYKYLNVTTADNTVVKAAPGILAGIAVNGGTMGQIIVYDNTVCAGTIYATVASPTAGSTIPGGVKFTTGICVNTADNTNITVVYQ